MAPATTQRIATVQEITDETLKQLILAYREPMKNKTIETSKYGTLNTSS